MAIGRKVLIVLSILLYGSMQADAQKVNSKISKRDDRNIREQAKATIEGLARLMNTIADPSLSSTDLDDAVANSLTGGSRIFYQDDFEVDDDSNPENNTSGTDLRNISTYLHQFHNFYHPKKEGSIKYDVTDIPEIRVGQNNLYLKVYYTQTMNGTNSHDVPFEKRFKVAEMQVVSANGQYQTLINAINFADKKESGGFTVVTIVDAKSDDAGPSDGENHSADYYKQRLSLGSRLLSENNFTESYYNLKEARKSKSFESDADGKLNELFAKIRSQNMDPTEALFNGLFSRAQTVLDKYRYNEAKQYYSYAKEVKPSSGKAIGLAISAVNERQSKEQLLFKLYDQGAYAEAVKGFQKAIDKNQSDNPSLFIGLGRSQQALGNDDEALAAFNSAIKADPSFAESYKWLGYFYKYKKNFKAANDAFVNYQSRADDPGDPIVGSEVALCRGMQAFDRHENSSAIDFLNSAVSLNSNNKEASLGLANVYLDQRDIKSAKKSIRMVLDHDNSYAEGYYIQAKILEVENDKKGAEASYKSAIKFDPKNYVYYYDLGKIQMEPELAAYQEAIQNFSVCIDAPVKMLFTRLAYWKRAKCYYNLGNRDEESFQDFKKAETAMPAKPPAFYVEYANLLIRTKQYDKAMENLSHASTDPSANLSMGMISYIQFPQDEDKFLNYFERAFRDGVSAEAVKNNSTITELYNNNKRFKSLVKKYKYNTYL